VFQTEHHRSYHEPEEPTSHLYRHFSFPVNTEVLSTAKFPIYSLLLRVWQKFNKQYSYHACYMPVATHPPDSIKLIVIQLSRLQTMQVTEIYHRYNWFTTPGGSSPTEVHFYKVVTFCARFPVFTAVLIKVKVFRDMRWCKPAVQLVTDM